MTLELTPDQRTTIISAVQTRLDDLNSAAQHLWDVPQSTRDTMAAENMELHTLLGHLNNSTAIILHRP